ncbi:4Fe-4S dicluster domain-containing protein [Candidatus Desantisbacteria bacterium]|nr:4Fe-4S dicluster domain-containing protein [Candidatus Desantisbacteria bacterium]
MAKNFAFEIEKETGINVFSCYQCGKCSAGCVFAQYMDIPPHLLMRLIQLNLREKALYGNTIWRCGSCITCSVRCPREIDVMGIINAVRCIAVKEKVLPEEKDEYLFDEIFLDMIIKNGRFNEVLSVIKFNLKSGKYFKDADLLPAFIEKGKLSSIKSKFTSHKIAELQKKIK